MRSYNIHARAAGNVGPGQCTVSGLCLLLSYRHMLPVLQSYNYPHFCGVNQGGAQPPATEKNVIMIQAQHRAPALHMLAPGPHPLLCAARVCRVIAVPGCGGRPHLFLLDTVSYVTPHQHQHPAPPWPWPRCPPCFCICCCGEGEGVMVAEMVRAQHSWDTRHILLSQ